MNSKRSFEQKERIHVYPFSVRGSSCALMIARLEIEWQRCSSFNTVFLVVRRKVMHLYQAFT